MNMQNGMDALKGLTLDPMFGWIVSPILAVAIVALTVVLAVRSHRQRPYTDATAVDWTRRILAAVMLAVMLLTPSTTLKTESRAVNATDVFIAVDVTGSMGVSDAQYGSEETMSRIDAAQQAVDGIVKLYPDASFAAISFGASGTLEVPLTPDSRAIENWASTLTLEPTSASSGSNLDKAVDPLLLATKNTRNQHPDDTIIVYYISDGEQTSNKSRRTFSSLRAYVNGAQTVGVGSTDGGQIPQIADDGSMSTDQFVTDPSTGQPGISKLDEKTLKAIADEMSGSYVHVDAGRTIDERDVQQTSSDWRMQSTYKQREHSVPAIWPFAIVFAVLLLWEAVAWMRTSRRLL
ncbi:VWA domain-containing protein [Bifidobacterium vansinderenii]|uniref:VWA domain-containing protein n=1 Tax=Bifidobacterium vansinderenii TaxID=1984871 RepID=A0A229W165_9BIFI|nr:VWA domain-containing protein [Bifidobacterium vansinderenii]OXN01566.1 VWA domain-containing protein [Bifidobacterium vansinderenii]